MKKAQDLADLKKAGRLHEIDFSKGDPMPPPRGRAQNPWLHLPRKWHPDLSGIASAAARRKRTPFPVAALPPAIAELVSAVATFSQTPVDLPGVVALGVLSAAVAGKARVVVKGNYSEPLNVFAVVGMPPASRKSAVFTTMFGPIAKHEERLRQEARGRVAVVMAERRQLEDDAKGLRRRLTSAKGAERAEVERDVAENARRLAELPPEGEPVLYLQDVTSEELARVLEAQDGRVAIADAEGVFFNNVLGRYSEDPNIDNVLKSHAGDSIRVSRVGRPFIHIPRPAVTMAMVVQPHVISTAANKAGVRERGFIGRILMAMPPSLIGRRLADPPEVPKHLWSRYAEAVRKLLELARPSEDWYLRLDPEARAAWHGFWGEIEARLGEEKGGDLARMSDWAGKLPGAVARLAGILHFADAACRGDEAMRAAWNAPISEATMMCAIELGWYFLDHAKAVYGELLMSREERAKRDLVGDMAAVLWSFDPERQGVLCSHVVRALWPHGHKGPVPDEVAAAREVVLAFAGVRGSSPPTTRALGRALAAAADSDGARPRIDRLGQDRKGFSLWSWAPQGAEVAPNSAEKPAPKPAESAA